MQVLFVSGIGGDTRRYRCAHHQEQLALRGIGSVLREHDDPRLYVDVTEADLLVLHRVPWSPLIADIVAIAHARGRAVVFETDDLIFAPELFDRIAYLDTLPPDKAAQFRRDLAGQVETFAHCDCVLTTTQFLADAAAERGKPAYIQRNAFSAEMVAASETAYALRRQRLAAQSQPDRGQAAPLVIGYFSGTGSHNRDFALVAPVLAELMGRYPNVLLHLSGHLEIGGTLLAYQERIRRAPFVAWQELPNLVAQVDINLAPLELDNPFTQAKSEIKYTEAALVGVPTVASPTDAFAYAIADGETGFLAAAPAEWSRALTALVEDPALRERSGEAARRAVYDAYLPERAAARLVETVNAIIQRHAPRAATSKAILATTVQRMYARLEQQQAQLVQLERQAEQLRHTLAQWENRGGSKDAAFWRTSLEANKAHQQAVLREILERLERGGGA